MCPAYTLAHTSEQELLKFDLNFTMIVPATSDGLIDMIDLFAAYINKCMNEIFSWDTSVSILTYNLRESAILLPALSKYGKNDFYLKETETQQKIRLESVKSLTPWEVSSRLRAEASIELKDPQSVLMSRPRDVHTLISQGTK